MQVRLNYRLAIEHPSGFANVQHIDVVFRRHGHGILLLRVPLYRMKCLLANGRQDAEKNSATITLYKVSTKYFIGG